MPARNDLPERIITPRTIVRRAAREDLPQIAAWPRYCGLHEAFSMLPAGGQAGKTDKPLWWQRLDWPDRAQYSVVDSASGQIIGVHVFCNIDWDRAAIGNMGIRIRADLCGQGLGSETLAPLLKAALAGGFRRIRLDVAAPNARAIRCYQRCGMRIAEEWWRPGLVPSDPDDPIWALVRPHARREGEAWVIRFYWMEIP